MANEKRLIDVNKLERLRYTHVIQFWDGKLIKSLPLSDAPTVDAVEVVHAHWEDGCAIHNGKEVYKSIDCSYCNEIFKTEDREYWKKRFKVCPFCGAIMDGERRTDKKAERT